MRHLANWIEIPVLDMNRAIRFYNEILDGVEFYQMGIGEISYALFPCEDKFNAGALVQGEYYKPSTDGVTLYLDGGKDLNIILERVIKAGGNVIMEKTYLGEQAGFVGMFIDCEGNKIGLQHL